jgi:hypothetical protein
MSKEYFKEPKNYEDQCVDGAYEGFGVNGELDEYIRRENSQASGKDIHSSVRSADSVLERSREVFRPIKEKAMKDLGVPDLDSKPVTYTAAEYADMARKSWSERIPKSLADLQTLSDSFGPLKE